jgi:hypothetical protein
MTNRNVSINSVSKLQQEKRTRYKQAGEST